MPIVLFKPLSQAIKLNSIFVAIEKPSNLPRTATYLNNLVQMKVAKEQMARLDWWTGIA